MPLSYPPLRPVEVDGVKRWTATCRTCGQDVVTVPQIVKAAVDEARRAHGHEAHCTRVPAEPTAPGVIPCEQHASILNPSFPWHRVLEVAEDCTDCEETS
ncbi:hypothetical protein [Microbacterium sp. AR7-10]|uniref:hypothetical protein n=1 Tax=Microbacterium sp. AR7-10 TaxID=1891970 RepID=UPI0008FCD096|nr:hypothetical protein [Microbacterium sp. AR7-10]OIU88626.1 hypothetical protein BFN01_04075 [Microbacterium sp. AR7-10]